MTQCFYKSELISNTPGLTDLNLDIPQMQHSKNGLDACLLLINSRVAKFWSGGVAPLQGLQLACLSRWFWLVLSLCRSVATASRKTRRKFSPFTRISRGFRARQNFCYCQGGRALC